MKQLRVSAIQNGTVIDHIPSANVFKIVEILKAQNATDEVLIGSNLRSKKLGVKGIIKLSEVFLSPTTINKIALLAPESTIITIKDFEVENKRVTGMPKTVVGIVRCFNPNCITNHEASNTMFDVVGKGALTLKCHYCEKIMDEEQLEFR